jgi:hypothetical protein
MRGFSPPLTGGRPLGLAAETIGLAAELLELQIPAASIERLAAALREIAMNASSPLAAAAGASRAAMAALSEAAPLEAEILSLWLADLALAQRLFWRAPIPLLAVSIAQPALRRAGGRRPRPSDPNWENTVAGAYALAATEAYGLGGELARRAKRLVEVQPKLRAKDAARLVALLLADDCLSPARAAKAALLSDRAARRLFDRLIALDAAREVSGRPNFRLYGL